MSIWVGIAAILLGLMFALAETMVPSHGVLTALSAASFVGGLYVGFQVSTTTGLAFAAVTVLLLPVIVGFGFYMLPRTWVGRKLILRTDTSAEKLRGSVADYPSLMDKEGVAVTLLRPAGMAQIEKQRVNVVTEGEIIEKGSRIKVVDVQGNRIVVRTIRV